ncbi:CaiB/BaiF CoA-transferase family protein [Parafrankia sp. FMc2]|uniref:CaiB/BaiF CoA-transferase family protein n=1 Tax=Parafrankia sp. FMc2 TaxID=3233196 RepID=UPI0034D7A4C8
MNDTPELPALDGVRVLDASYGISGPLAGMVFGDYGAEVIRLDAPADPDDRARPGAVVWHRNKTIVPPDLGPELAAEADLVLTSDRRTAAALGLGLDAEPREGLVHLHLPLWGEEIDLDPFTRDRMVAADFGAARRQTSFSGGPVDEVYPFLAYMQGTWGAACGIAALVERVRSGRGQRVVVDPLHGSMVATVTTMLVSPTERQPDTSVGPGGPNPTFGTYQCADGEWLFVGALGSKFQDILFTCLGTTDIVDDPRIKNVRERLYAPENRGWVRARLTEAFLRDGRAGWLEKLTAAGCPVSPVGDRDDWLDHPQIAALGQRVDLDDPLVGPSVVVGVGAELSRGALPRHQPRRFQESATWQPRTDEPRTPLAGPPVPSATPPVPPVAPPAPLPAPPAWHAESPGPLAAAPPALPAAGLPVGFGPLAGITVVDLGTVLAGPYAGMLLAALGANVLKVEITKGDELRLRGYGIARGQRGLGIDLRDPEGYAAFLRVVAGSDVVLDNFRPGVLERLRLDDATLRATNPEVVTTSITGYGGTGPLGRQPGYDPVVQALSGIMKAQGGTAEPVFSTLAINDVTVACLAALGTCAALYQKAVGRGGQHVASSLATAATFMQSGELVRYTGRTPAETGGRDFPGPGALSRFYACADGWVRVHLRDFDQAVAAGLARLADATGSTDAARSTDATEAAELTEAELVDQLTASIGALTSEKVVAIVSAAGGAAVRARDFTEVVGDPELVDDGHVVELVWPDGNSTLLPHRLAEVSGHAPHPVMKATGHGEHSRELLAEAGLSEAEIEHLISSGAVVVGEPMYSVMGVGYR